MSIVALVDLEMVICERDNHDPYKDSQGRLWIPDTEGGKRHWDVQRPPYKRNNYFKVTPDGRLLDRRPH